VPSVWNYVRVSREDQNLALQFDALEAAGITQANIVEEKESGTRQRPGFHARLKRLRRKDSLLA
jgi:DNA invertase Pin-like site-specific DNA recombinase